MRNTTGLSTLKAGFENSFAALPKKFYEPVTPESVPNPVLQTYNWKLGRALGLNFTKETQELPQCLAGNLVFADAAPIAMAYAGHQFGTFVHQLGDGRAVLLGEKITPDGKRFDVQLKGSGRTPFSRGGDGKSPLGPVIREYIVSEAMHALGVPTTRALAMVCTGERIMRPDGIHPGGIMTRVASVLSGWAVSNILPPGAMKRQSASWPITSLSAIILKFWKKKSGTDNFFHWWP